MHNLKPLSNLALLVVFLSGAASLNAQSPAADPPSQPEDAGQTESQRKENDPVKTEAAEIIETLSDKYIAKTFGPRNKGLGTTKFLTPDAKENSDSVIDPKNRQTDPEDWEVAFAPYLYMTGISGTIGAQGRTIEIDSSFGSVLSNLSFGLMGTLQVKKGRFVSFSDLMWIKLGVERDTPGPLYNSARVDVNLFIFDPEVGYRLYESDKGSFDVLGGIRMWSVENSLETTTGVAQGFTASQRKTWVAFVGGFHGSVNVSPRVFLATKFDIGAGSGTDITTQIYAGAGFRIKPKISLIGGYRFLKVNHDDESGFVFNTHMNGFLAGAKFQF